MTSKLTREENVQAVFDLKAGYTLGLADVEILKRVARMALAAMDSEPVAYRWNYGGTTTWRLQDTKPTPGSNRIWPRVIEPLYRHAQQPVVPDAYVRDERGRMMLNGVCEPKIGFGIGWNACRSAMLQELPKSAGESNNCRSSENVQVMQVMQDVSRCSNKSAPALDSPPKTAESRVGNSPVIPDGYVMVPKDLLSELRDWAHPEIEKYCEMWEGRRDSEFPALRKVIADADALLAASPQEVKGE